MSGFHDLASVQSPWMSVDAGTPRLNYARCEPWQCAPSTIWQRLPSTRRMPTFDSICCPIASLAPHHQPGESSAALLERLDQPRPRRTHACQRRAPTRALEGVRVTVFGVDRFPRMVDRVIPSCGSPMPTARATRTHVADGTVVMHEGFINFNAGTLGVHGGAASRQGVVDGSDIGGGASIMELCPVVAPR